MCRTWEVLTCHGTSTKEGGGDLQKQNLPLSSLSNMAVFIVSDDEDEERGGAPVVHTDDVSYRLSSSKFQTRESSSTWAPVLLLVPLVLGLDKVSPRSRTKNTLDQVSPISKQTVFNSIGGIVSQATQEKRQQQPPNLVSLSSSGDQSHSTAGNDTTEFCKTKILVRKTPAERCFLWLGGFRSSELLKLLANQLEPLTEQ